jgi:hypothetical protein
MCVKKLIKENPSLAAGIILPVLLVIVFAVATAIPGWTVPLPKYDLLFTVDQSNMPDLSIGVFNGQMKARYSLPSNPMAIPQATVYRFNASTQSVSEIAVPLPDMLDDKEALNTPPANDEKPANKNRNSYRIQLPIELLKLTVNPNLVAPDGYVFHSRAGYDNGGWLFFSHYRNDVMVSKNGRNILITLPNSPPYGSNSIKFVGWIVPEGTAK